MIVILIKAINILICLSVTVRNTEEMRQIRWRTHVWGFMSWGVKADWALANTALPDSDTVGIHIVAKFGFSVRIHKKTPIPREEPEWGKSCRSGLVPHALSEDCRVLFGCTFSGNILTFTEVLFVSVCEREKRRSTFWIEHKRGQWGEGVKCTQTPLLTSSESAADIHI